MISTSMRSEYFNFSDSNSKFHTIAMFETVNIDMKFHMLSSHVTNFHGQLVGIIHVRLIKS